MVDQKIVNYVNSAMKSGKSPETIKSELIGQGWPENDINQALSGTPPVASPPSKSPAPVKPGSGSHKKIYLIGLVAVIIIMAVTAFYLMLIIPVGTPEATEKCGNGVCDMGETYSSCPADCEEPEPPPVPVPSGPISIGFSPATKTVSKGETFSLDVIISDAYTLFGFQFDVEYDSDVLELEGISEGTFLSDGQDQTFCVPHKTSDGLIQNIACVRLGKGSVDGDGTLETITFKAIGSGTSEIKLSNVKIANSKAEKLESSVSNGEVTVS